MRAAVGLLGPFVKTHTPGISYGDPLSLYGSLETTFLM